MPKRKAQSMEKQRGRVDVMLDHEIEVPWCDHGPCLLFIRYLSDGSQKHFFACAVYRDRKDCSFYAAVDLERPKIPKTLRPTDKELLEREKRHKNLFKKYKTLFQNDDQSASYCTNCNVLFDKTTNEHSKHDIRSNLTKQMLRNPSTVIPALSKSSKESQYWFSNSTLDFLLGLICDHSFQSVLCIGAPRLFESLRSHNFNVKTMLLDFDSRYENFLSPKQFVQFSMFSGCFYTDIAEGRVKDFLNSEEKTLICIDPPFGGLVAPLAKTTKILQNLSTSKSEVIWVYPYFIGKQIDLAFPEMKMLEYEITYENQRQFSTNKSSNPVRLFTTIDPATVTLPDSDYKLCKLCNKSVGMSAKHCDQCNQCFPSIGTKSFTHCNQCLRCVKTSFSHCDQCNKCHNPSKSCVATGACHICGENDHKRSNCPKKRKSDLNISGKSKKKRKT